MSLTKSAAVLLPIYEADSYVFLQKLVLMSDGVLELNPIKHMSYGFYNYGYLYFLFCLIITWPFILLKKYGMVIFICRFISSIFLILTCVVLKRIFISKLRPIIGSFLVFSFISIVTFWKLNNLFYPDYLMIFFITLSLFYFLVKSKQSFTYFWYGVFVLAVAVGIKVQALLYIPLFVLIGAPLLLYHNPENELKKSVFWLLKKIGLMILVFILVFIIVNPFIIHPKGLLVFLHRLEENLQVGGRDFVLISHLLLYAVIFVYSSLLYFIKKPIIQDRVGKLGFLTILLVLWSVIFFGVTSKYFIVFYVICFIYLFIYFSYWNELRHSLVTGVIVGSLFLLNIVPIQESLSAHFFFREDAREKHIQLLTSLIQDDITPNDYILVSNKVPIDVQKLDLPITHLEYIHSETLESYRFEKKSFFQKWKAFDLKKNTKIKPFTPKKYIVLEKRNHGKDVDLTINYLYLNNEKKSFLSFKLFYEDEDFLIYKHNNL